MTTLLHIDSSARVTRSISRSLSDRFVDAWRARRPSDRVIRRDLAANPPPLLDERWIAAAFTPPDKRDDAMREALAYSDAVGDEVFAADVIVMGAPMYNSGMSGALKAWFDQVIRVGRTFSFDIARGDRPIEPMLSGKRLVVLSSFGEFGFAPGAERAEENLLAAHLAALAPSLGVATAEIRTIGVEYQEFGGERHARSRADAEAAIDALVARMAPEARDSRAGSG